MWATTHQFIGQDTQPTGSVIVCQRNTGAHFGHVLWRMKLISFDQGPP
jgi:hypothetical protein